MIYLILFMTACTLIIGLLFTLVATIAPTISDYINRNRSNVTVVATYQRKGRC